VDQVDKIQELESISVMEKAKVQSYINNFRRFIARFLKSDIGLHCNVYNTEREGAIVEFKMALGITNDDVYFEDSSTLSEALGNVKQKAFGGNLGGFTFSGTNTILEDNRVIYIKDQSLSEWDESAAKNDVTTLVFSRTRKNT